MPNSRFSRTTILGVCSFVTAITASVASTLGAKEVYVKAKLTSNATAPTVCQNTGVECGMNGPLTCQVQIIATTGSNQIETGTSYRPYESSCTIQLKGSGHLLISTAQVFRLVSETE